MPPPRFKAVCTEAGRESKPFGLTERVRGAFRDPDICIFMSDEFEMPRTDKDHELCQSTGLTDSRGVEVFEGDVTFHPSGFGYQMIVSFFDGAFVVTPYRDWAFEKDLPPDYLAKHIKDHVVVGNKWQPAAELKARAEAVSNG